jgi:hypothetical protein
VSFPELTLLSNFKEENLIVCETLSSLKKEISITWPRTSKLGQNFEGIFKVLGQVLQSSWKSSLKFLASFSIFSQ